MFTVGHDLLREVLIAEKQRSVEEFALLFQEVALRGRCLSLIIVSIMW